jgi:deoxycytidine triphosphate deaminase
MHRDLFGIDRQVSYGYAAISQNLSSGALRVSPTFLPSETIHKYGALYARPNNRTRAIAARETRAVYGCHRKICMSKQSPKDRPAFRVLDNVISIRVADLATFSNISITQQWRQHIRRSRDFALTIGYNRTDGRLQYNLALGVVSGKSYSQSFPQEVPVGFGLVQESSYCLLSTKGWRAMLTKTEIQAKKIVQGAQVKGERATTYDATVGDIIERGKIISEAQYTLRPRGIVWVVSQEEFHLPAEVTGLATLRTTWTHGGVLALNVGVVDPGWQGPLATAVVNFGNGDFTIKKGDPFLRLLFGEHPAVSPLKVVKKDRDAYIKDTVGNSKAFSTKFLNTDALIDEVASEILKFPKWVYALTILGILLTLLSIFAPIAYSVWTDRIKSETTIAVLTADVAEMKTKLAALEASRPDANNGKTSQQVEKKSANPATRSASESHS